MGHFDVGAAGAGDWRSRGRRELHENAFALVPARRYRYYSYGGYCGGTAWVLHPYLIIMHSYMVDTAGVRLGYFKMQSNNVFDTIDSTTRV